MNYLKPLLPTLAAVILAVGVSHADFFYKWSQTAGTNANSDTFTWAEGQAPSTVNDSARSMMAALAKYRDDTSGKLVTTGTATVLALTTNSVFDTLANMDGAKLTFRMNVTTGAAPTLNVDTLGAKALNQATGVAVATGALISGAVYSAVYVNASNEWIVSGVAGSIPSGTAMLSTTAACPGGWTQSVAHNDKALRLVSGVPGTGNDANVVFSTVFGRTGTTPVTLAAGNIPQLSGAGLTLTTPGHSHPFTYATQTVAAGGGQSVVTAIDATAFGTGVNTNTGSTGTAISGNVGSASPSTFTPAIDMRVRYVDVIICTKN